MANIIRFEFKTDAPWSEDELDGLNSELAEVVERIDDDHIPGSFDVHVIEEGATTQDNIREAAEELLKKAAFNVTVNVTDADGEEYITHKFSTEE